MKLKIIGKQIYLQPLEKSDDKAICKNVNKHICTYALLPYPYKLKHAQDFIKYAKKKLKEKTAYHMRIAIKSANELIGIVSLHELDLKNHKSECGIWLGQKYWGKGIAKEATILMLNFGFNKLKLERIYAITSSKNTTVPKLLNRIGFKRESLMRKSYFNNGKYVDGYMYAILKEEFKQLSAL